MKANYTHTVLVLDKSGSMETIRHDTAGSVNSFIKQQKAVPGEATFQLIQFNTDHIAGPIHDIRHEPEFSVQGYRPDGSTALLDAVGKAIEDTGEFLNGKLEPDRPSRVIIVIATDGQENASRKFTRERIFEMVTMQRDVYKWDFVFLGANIDSFMAAGSIGIGRQATSNYAHNAGGVAAAYASTGRNIAALRCCADPDQGYAFTKEQQDANEQAK